MTFADRLRAKAKAKQQPTEYPKIAKTGELYRVPRVHQLGTVPAAEPWAAECITWPRYANGVFALPRKAYPIEGECMLEMTQAEQEALRIVVLRCNVQKEVYGAAHHMSWKNKRTQQSVLPKRPSRCKQHAD